MPRGYGFKSASRHNLSNGQSLYDILVEIQEVAYSLQAQKTPRSVLRFHNLTWYHGMLCKTVFRFSLRQVTTRILYCSYFHNSTFHASNQNRISGRSASIEEQETVFNSINAITRLTSSYHPDYIIGSMLIQVVAEKELPIKKVPSSFHS